MGGTGWVDNDNDTLSGDRCLKLVGVGILPQPSPYKAITPYERAEGLSAAPRKAVLRRRSQGTLEFQPHGGRSSPPVKNRPVDRLLQDLFSRYVNREHCRRCFGH